MLKFVCFFFLLFFQFDFGSNAMVGGKSVLTYNDFMSSDYLLVRERLGSFLEKSNSNNLCGFCSLKRYVCGTKQVVAGLSLNVEFVAQDKKSSGKMKCIYNIWYQGWMNFVQIKPISCRRLEGSSSRGCDIRFPRYMRK